MKKVVVASIIAMILLAGGLIASFVLFQDPFYLIKPELKVDRIMFGNDKNANGTDDSDDILAGAREEVKRKVKYHSAYYVGGYPPENEGVCTDVIWRALQNAGYNLKAAMDTDIKKNTKAYKGSVTKPDPNIDFRRVKNQLVYFKSYAKTLTSEVIPFDAENASQWQGGDIVVLEDTDHIAIISDQRRRDGVPYVIHNGTDFPREEDRLLTWYRQGKIVGHFRYSDMSRD